VNAASGHVAERTENVAGLPILWREANPPGDASATPVVYLHGNPTDGDDFLPMLERAGGVAPDLPGFGRSAKPSSFDYSIAGYTDFLEAFVDHLGLERLSLVVHDWGAVGLALAQRRPQAIERLVISNCVPFLPGYRWHRWAMLWRARLVGELAMGFTTRFALRSAVRRGFATRGPAVDALIDRAWSHFDHGTQRAALRLYRSAPPDVLEWAGARLGAIEAPALIVWGDSDPWISPGFAHAYGEALGGPARVEIATSAGHWPWIDRPELVDQIASFLLEG
jgi:pimeloyl-ACP methyl ester carboxylesterase